MAMNLPFDSRETWTYTTARLEHVGYMFPELARVRVLDLGAGVGNLSGFFEQRGCEVMAVEGRKELCDENLRRNPHRCGRVFCRDVTVPGQILTLGDFDVVLCYGLLYHVGEPAQLIQEMSQACMDLLLIETIVNANDEGDANLIDESADIDQSLWGKGCRPNRHWLVEEMQRNMPYVYQPRTCPKYGQFIMQFPSTYMTPRVIMVGSRRELDPQRFHLARPGDLINEFDRDW